MIKQHRLTGAALLEQVPELRDAVPVVRSRHEWYDGSGYPDRLQGEATPYLARILSVADAYCAMISDRPQRRAMKAHEARAIFLANASSQFDANCRHGVCRDAGRRTGCCVTALRITGSNRATYVSEGGMRVGKKGVLLLYLVLHGLCAVPAMAGDYHLGAGENIGPVNLAGYSNLVFEAPHNGPDALVLEGLSLFVSAHVNRYFNPFVEVEIGQATLIAEHGGASSGKTSVERLYNDFELTPSATLRVGKMLAPVGEWNLIHAAPLMWTVTRPLSTYYSFPVFVSGASLDFHRASDANWGAQIYLQPGSTALAAGDELELRQYANVGGLDVRYTGDVLNRFGVSLQTANVRGSGGNQTLGSLYGGFGTGSVMWDFQADITDIRGGTVVRAHDREGGGFLQAVYPLTSRWFIVGQGELFQARDYAARARRWAIGAVYRPRPAISWKLEYLAAQGAPVGEPGGVYAAWAVLF
ncbi:MAG: HD-GYP domain-containing protein [Sulfuricella sp.]